MAGNNKRSQLFHKLTPEQHRYVIDGLEKLWAEAFENPDASLQEIRPLFLLLQQAKREYQQRAGVPTGWTDSVNPKVGDRISVAGVEHIVKGVSDSGFTAVPKE